MASSRPIIAPERSRRGRKYTVPPYTPVIAYDFCRERLPGVKEHMDRTVCPVRGAGGMG